MYKSLSILLLIVSFSSHAGLWCSLSNGDTPTQAAANNNTPYQTVQIDQMNEDTIQIDIVDIYGNGQNSRVIQGKSMNPEANTVNGVITGKYNIFHSDETAAITVDKNGSIKLKLSSYNFSYDCETLD